MMPRLDRELIGLFALVWVLWLVAIVMAPPA